MSAGDYYIFYYTLNIMFLFVALIFSSIKICNNLFIGIDMSIDIKVF